MNDLSNKLAVKIFDELYDEEDLKELEQKKVIVQALGFKLSTIAIIECEIKEYLQQDKAELVEALSALSNHICPLEYCTHDEAEAFSKIDELLEKHKC